MILRCLIGLLHSWLAACRKQQRQCDIDILWPVIRRNARSLDHAKTAFLFHVFHDPAWKNVSATELEEHFRGLK